MADDDFQYESGFGNEFATEAVKGALPVGRNSPQRAPLGLYAEQLSGTAFTQPRARQPADLGVPDPAVGQAPGLPPDRQQEPKIHPVRRARTEPEPAALGPAPAPGSRRADGLHRRPLHRRRQRRQQDQGRDGRPPLRGQHVHARPLLRRLRRRAALRPRAERGHPAHRARPAAGQPGRDRGGAARHPLPGRAARRASPAATCARTSAPASPSPSAGRSAPTAWPTSATSSTRTPPSRSATTPSRW